MTTSAPISGDRQAKNKRHQDNNRTKLQFYFNSKLLLITSKQRKQATAPMTRSSSSAASAGTSSAASDNPSNPVSFFLQTIFITVAVYCYHVHNNDNQSVMASLAAVGTIIAIAAVPELVRRYIMNRSSTSTPAVPSSPWSVMTPSLRRSLTAITTATNIIMNGRGGPTDVLPRAVATNEADRSYARIARTVLKNMGFDPDNPNKEDKDGWTPMTYYSREGNVTMIRYLIACGIDGRKEDFHGWWPMYYAAYYGRVDVMTVLFHEGGAHDDIRKITMDGSSPLSIALFNDHFDVVYWLLLNGALWSSHDGDWFRWWQGRIDGGIVQERIRGWMDDNGSIINDASMRRDLSPTYSTGRSRQWGSDKRETVHAWAQDIVTNYDNVVTLLLTGTFASASTSPLVVFKGPSEILELIAQYVAGTPQRVRMSRQLLVLLPAFIDDTPFVPVA